MSAILECANLNLVYLSKAGPLPVLGDLSIHVDACEFVAILGPSGCGKSTLLRLVAGLEFPTSGTLTRLAKRPSLVFQDGGLFPWMTVLENAAFGLECLGQPKARRESDAAAFLSRLGLDGHLSSYPAQLSVGMAQRVALARTFLAAPDLLLLDEPFCALDALTRTTLQFELLALWQQTSAAILFVTHDVDEAILLADRILVLSPRPASLVAEFEVDAPRPRSSESLLDPVHLDLKRQVLHALGAASAVSHRTPQALWR